jgi:hypothetical protein
MYVSDNTWLVASSFTAEHHADELEIELLETLLEEFSCEAEDGSPAQVTAATCRQLIQANASILSKHIPLAGISLLKLSVADDMNAADKHLGILFCICRLPSPS